MQRSVNGGFRSGPASGRAPAASREDPIGAAEKRPWDIFLLVVAALVLVAYARLHSFIPGATVLRPGLLLAVVALGAWAANVNHQTRSPKALRNPMVGAATAMVVWAAVGVPFALWPGGAASFLLDSFVRTFLVFLLVAAAVRNLEDVRRLVGVIAFGVAAFAVLSPSPGIGRAVSGGGYDPNDAAMLLASGLPAVVFFVLFGRSVRTRIAAGIGTLAVLGSLVLSQSRGGFVAVLAVLAFLILMLKGVKPVLRAMVVGAVVLASVPFATTEFWDRMQTITEFDDGYGEGGTGGRRNIWTRAVGYTADNPVTGVGVANFTVAEGRHGETRERVERGIGTKYSAAHSIWFQVMAELGIPGFLAFLAFFGITLRRLRSIQQQRWPPRVGSMRSDELVVMAGILMAIVVGAMVAGTFLSNGYSALVWVPMALCVGFIKVIDCGEHSEGGVATAASAPAGIARLRPSARPPHARL